MGSNKLKSIPESSKSYNDPKVRVCTTIILRSYKIFVNHENGFHLNYSSFVLSQCSSQTPSSYLFFFTFFHAVATTICLKSHFLINLEVLEFG